MYKEIGRTVRAALRGWAPTFRLIALMATVAALWLAISAFGR